MTLVGMGNVGLANETKSYSYDALGRVIAVQISGAVNSGQAHSLCYDPAGNRTLYKSNSAGALAVCNGTPTPTPTPTNKPPIANPDTISLAKCRTGSKNVIANDTDPEGNYPLVLTAVNQSWAYVANSTTVSIQAPETNGTYIVTYTVADSLGATAQGSLTLTVSGSQQCV